MEILFNGIDLGNDDTFIVTGIDGWEDTPGLVSGSTVRPRRHGSWPGGILAPKRVVTIDFLVTPGSGGVDTQLAKMELRKALRVSDTELPLTIDLGWGREVINARVTGFNMPTAAGYEKLQTASVEFTASDPRRYAATWTTARFGLRTRQAIPVYPVKYPKRYVRYGNPGDRILTSGGTVASPPNISIIGPIVRPTITFKDALGIRKTTFALTVPKGRTLSINVANGTAKMGGGSFYGDSRGALIEDMLINPGTSTVHFAGSGKGSESALLDIAWRDATL